MNTTIIISKELDRFIEEEGKRYYPKLISIFERIEKYGLAGFYIKALRDKLYEIRLSELRVLFFYDSGRIIVLASAFIKKGRKTPESAIRKALQVRACYMKQTRQI